MNGKTSNKNKPLSKEVLQAIMVKNKQMRSGISIPLRKLSQSTNIEKVFGSELSRRLAYLSRVDGRTGKLSRLQKNNIKAIVFLLNQTINEQLDLKGKFISANSLENAITTGNPEKLVKYAANSLLKWKNSLPLETIRAIERTQLEISYRTSKMDVSQLEVNQQSLQEEESDSLEEDSAGIANDWAAVAFVAGAATIGVVIEIVNIIGGWLSGPEREYHRHVMPGGVIIDSDSYLRVPWRGIEWGDNNQFFHARYILNITGGLIDKLKVIFETRFEGSGFDRLNYPMDQVNVWDLEHGIHAPEFKPIRTTRYNQIHEIELHDVGYFGISVQGRVYYGMDGWMSGAGMVPQVTAVKSGHTYKFPQGESIWQYGVSI